MEEYIGKWVSVKSKSERDRYCLIKRICKDQVIYHTYFSDLIIDKDSSIFINNENDLKIVETSEVIQKAKEYGHDLKSLGLEEKNDYSQYIGQWVTYSGWQRDSYCLFKNIKGNRLYFSVGFQEDKLDKNDWWACTSPKKLEIIPALNMSKILQQFGHTELVDTLLDVPEIFTVKKVSKELIINYPFSTELNTLPEIKLNNKQFKF